MTSAVVTKETSENTYRAPSKQRVFQRYLVFNNEGYSLAEIIQALAVRRGFDQTPQLALGEMASVLANSDPVRIIESIATIRGTSSPAYNLGVLGSEMIGH
jgi:hypothetical protein